MKNVLLALFISLFALSGSMAQSKSVCFTLDDLPTVAYRRASTPFLEKMTHKLVDTLVAHSIPAIGFVNEHKLYSYNQLDSARVDLLRYWLSHGLVLGNHTYSHLNYHKVTLPEYTDDIAKGERVIKPLAASYGKSIRYFRHPYLMTGETKAQSEALQHTLDAMGYEVAPVTIDNGDYLFARAYGIADQQKDLAKKEKIGKAYLHYMEQKLLFYEAFSDSLFQRNISQILLMHASLLNADYLGSLIKMFQQHGYRFVSLRETLQDPAYATPITRFGNWGISWMDRWALSQQKGLALLKQDPKVPAFITKSP